MISRLFPALAAAASLAAATLAAFPGPAAAEDQPTQVISGTLWWETVFDGIRAEGEAVAPGMTVTLTNPITSEVMTTTSDALGRYRFEVPEGTAVKLRVLQTQRTSFWWPNRGADDSVDSDFTWEFVEAKMLYDAVLTLPDAGVTDYSQVDLGMAIGNLSLTSDLMTPGRFDVGDFVEIRLTPSNAGPTDFQSYRMFWRVPAGLNFVSTIADSAVYQCSANPVSCSTPRRPVITIPAGQSGSPATARLQIAEAGCFRISSGVLGENNVSIFETVPGALPTVGQNTKLTATDNDAHTIVCTEEARVGSFVFIDNNGDGRQDPTDTPVEGATLTLTNPDGTPVHDLLGELVTPIRSNADGSYLFVNLKPGQYVVTIDSTTAPALQGLVPAPAGVGTLDQDSSTGSATSATLLDDGEDLTLDFGFMAAPEVPTTDQPRQPVIRTKASTNTGSVGVRVRDRIWVSGLEATDRVRVNWTLRGPATPINGKCSRINWKKQPIRATGSYRQTGNGRHTTHRVPLNRAGCFTYSSTIKATTDTLRAVHRPGHPAQTIHVTARVSPWVNTGGAGWLF